MKRIIIGFAFLMLILGNVVSEDTNSGIIYGENWAFMFSTPEGYVWDNVSLQHEGIWALFYKEGQDEFYGSKHHLYINPIPKGNGYPSTLEELISWDISYFQKNDHDLKISYYTEMQLSDTQKVKIYSFDQDVRNYYMYFGYLTERNSSFIFVLISRTKEEREQTRKAYFDLIRNFRYFDIN